MIMQMKQRLLAVGLALGLGLLGSTANATIWATGPVWGENGSDYHACNVVNVSSVPITDVSIELYKSDGTVLTQSGIITLQPRISFELSLFGGYTGFASCRIFSAVPSWQIRGNITVYHWNGTYYETVAHDAAR